MKAAVSNYALEESQATNLTSWFQSSLVERSDDGRHRH